MKIIRILICSFICLWASSCSDQPIDSEQYIKEVYLIGAYDQVWPVDVMYSNEAFETHITVSTSGSLNLDKDIKVELEIDNTIIDKYNEYFLGILNQDKYYIPFDQSRYTIPSLNNVLIEHAEAFYKTVPILIETEGIDPDALYAIPVRIKNVSDYSVNPSGEKMLVKLNMKNEFHDQYNMEGTTTDASGNTRIIQKVKNLKAVGKQSIRMFTGIENENNDNLSTKSVVLTIGENNVSGDENIFPVTVTAWNSDSLEVVDGNGEYNAEEKTFNVTYSIASNGSVTIYNEELVIVEK